MGDSLSPKEEEFVELMKSLKILKKLETGREWCKNGGVHCTCGDGHKDIISYHKSSVHPYSTPLTPPGGPLTFSMDFLKKLYPDFSYEELLIVRRWNIAASKVYLTAKETRTNFEEFHYPCGAAKYVGFNLKTIVTTQILPVLDFFEDLTRKDSEFFRQERLIFKLHLVKRRGDNLVQRTREINIPNLRENMPELITYKY